MSVASKLFSLTRCLNKAVHFVCDKANRLGNYAEGKAADREFNDLMKAECERTGQTHDQVFVGFAKFIEGLNGLEYTKQINLLAEKNKLTYDATIALAFKEYLARKDEVKPDQKVLVVLALRNEL